MDLIHNGLYKVACAAGEFPCVEPGLYRVILNDLRLPRVAMVLVQPIQAGRNGRGGRPRMPERQLKRPRKKAAANLIGELLWLPRKQLEEIFKQHLLLPVEQDRPTAPELGKQSQLDYENRLRAMSEFLKPLSLQESILIHEGLGGLVREAVERTGCTRAFIYRQWSNLCRWGISERSLWPQRHRCGAPGVPKTCDALPDGRMSRRKAGRKTIKEAQDIRLGRSSAPHQPGMSELWAARIRAADKQIPEPKPAWPLRRTLILSSHFCTRAKEVDGRIQLVLPEIGTYPNARQIRRVVNQIKSRLERILERTTKRHFNAARRGLVARNWQGVPGPGHTWAIDSTIGDIYLRSSVNRSWIVGRPVVYVIVDVWSTAVVGFYVCLTGPSWNTAKISLFNAAADPALIGELWNYQPMLTLDPVPTLCAWLMTDRGEYLSAGHRLTALQLELNTSIAPPYRGDLKGLVEVLHRIAKDQIYGFFPGAMDFRREEMELRKVDPADAVLTVQDFTQVLYEVFDQYNLSADRSKRVDVHMSAAGVFPSPAGLWRYGHQMGVGTRRVVAFDDLAAALLPNDKAWVARDGVHFLGNDYFSEEAAAAQWTTLARNLDGQEIPAHYYPGSLGRVWVPREPGGSLMRLDLADESRARRNTTLEEWMDVQAFEAMRRPDVEHERTMRALQSLERRQAILQRATVMTQEAIARASGKAPSMSEARLMEVAQTRRADGSESKAQEALVDEFVQEHEEIMAALFERANTQGGRHD
ncbi:hypothetical protein HNQ51_003713 [Inhella inkyongensis]|uniref:Integrase catalytic domain-containing protein n=1 Tax=Inhella inkyongensis TaxID=392593 RepID=A0A840S4X2_9BURK|nr:DDE-type integrase/transposase/recombinase [Inhella inkyongensis]MBB5206367.1 hypothetical protein [Inhella inkyongensis]